MLLKFVDQNLLDQAEMFIDHVFDIKNPFLKNELVV